MFCDQLHRAAYMTTEVFWHVSDLVGLIIMIILAYMKRLATQNESFDLQVNCTKKRKEKSTNTTLVRLANHTFQVSEMLTDVSPSYQSFMASSEICVEHTPKYTSSGLLTFVNHFTKFTKFGSPDNKLNCKHNHQHLHVTKLLIGIFWNLCGAHTKVCVSTQLHHPAPPFFP